ncbi:MAG: 1-phosphofructokinase, partial [Oscillospiraceae bacterium]|nr:1-phosphofructokinase [Oscillospiraceae bacterium]
MIYTITTNPSLDYYMELDTNLVLGGINRSKSEAVYPGGKGINVAVMLARLGEDACALGFAAGTIGKAIGSLLRNEGCASEMIDLPCGESRINVKVLCEQETAVNGCGPAIDAASAQKLLEKADALTAEDTLVLSGNLQKSCENLYENLALRAKNAGARLVVDAT